MKQYKKAVTFSYDDGPTQDQRLIGLFDKYGLKATFNINSGLCEKAELLNCGPTVALVRPRIDELAWIYRNHEVAVHTLTHPMLPDLEEAEIIRQVEEDRKALSKAVGYEVCGMAYPCGGQNNDDRVAGIIARNTGVKYARGIATNHSFDLQDNLLRFTPTCAHEERETLFRLAHEFLALDPKEPKIFYIWGHSFEFDANGNWDWFEEFCQLISGKEDIFYGTNTEVFRLFGQL